MTAIKKFYKFTLEDDYELEIPPCFPIPDFQNEWISIKSNHLIINKGYSWDGCSPKRILFGKFIVGTWDGNINPKTGLPQLYYPSLVHDSLCQFKIPTRKLSDDIFNWMMVGVNFPYRGIYYSMVRTFSVLTFRR